MTEECKIPPIPDTSGICENCGEDSLYIGWVLWDKFNPDPYLACEKCIDLIVKKNEMGDG